MITKGNLERILEEKLGKENIKRVPSFSLEYILNSPRADEDSINKTYLLLKSYGISDEKIAIHAQLLGRDPETIEENYQNLRSYGIYGGVIAINVTLLGSKPETIERNHKNLISYGISRERIATNAALLGFNPETIEENYQKLRSYGISKKKMATFAALLRRDPETIERNHKNLRSYGISDEKIATNAALLGRDPETIERNHKNLISYGISKEKIATNAALLGRDPETIERNYQKAIALLRQNSQDRNSGKNLLINQPQLFGLSPENINENVQYLNSINIDYNNAPLLLGTKVQTKRGKMVWMLQNLFDYERLPSSQKSEAIQNMYDFIRGNPTYLVMSISALERKRDKLQKRVRKYYYS